MIRALALDDLPTVKAVEADAEARFEGLSVTLPEDFDTSHELVTAIQDGLAFGFDEGGLLGIVYGTALGESVFVEGVSVRTSAARRRIGSSLLDRLAQAGSELGLGSLILTTFADVPFNAPWYERLGFTEGAGSHGATKLSVEASRGFVPRERIAMRRAIEPAQDDVIEVFETDGADPITLAVVRALLNRAFPDGFSDHDWAHALGGVHAVVRRGGSLVAHAAVVPRTLYVGSARWEGGYVEAVAVDPSLQRSGLGTRVMRALTVRVRDSYDLLALCTGSPSFYERLGWQIWQGSTFVVRADGLEPTTGEDGSVLVLDGLRPLPALTGLLGCDERPGDDW